MLTADRHICRDQRRLVALPVAGRARQWLGLKLEWLGSNLKPSIFPLALSLTTMDHKAGSKLRSHLVTQQSSNTIPLGLLLCCC